MTNLAFAQNAMLALAALIGVQGTASAQIIARPVAPAPAPAAAPAPAPARAQTMPYYSNQQVNIRGNALSNPFVGRGVNAPVYGYTGGYFPFYSPFYSAYDYGGAYYYGVGDPNFGDFSYVPDIGEVEPYTPPRNFATPPPLPSDHPNTARLALQVPAGAEVWVQGNKYDIGTNHTFESPDLKKGDAFTFDVRVEWMENGKKVVEKRTIVMKPGDFQSLQYLGGATATAKNDKGVTALGEATK